MTTRRALDRRQQALLLRSAELRMHWAGQAQLLQPPLALADRVRDAWQWLRQHPGVPLIAAGVVVGAAVLLRPRRALRWGLRAWSGWQLWRRLRVQLAQRLAQPDGPPAGLTRR